MISLLRRLNPLRLPVRARLGLIQLFLVASLAVVAGMAWHRLSIERALGEQLALLSRAERYHLNGDNLHDALHADVEHALRSAAANPAESAKALTSARENARHYTANLKALDALDFPADLEQLLDENRAAAEAYIASANRIVALAATDRAQALQAEPAYSDAFEDLLDRNDRITETIAARVDLAERQVLDTENAGKFWIAATVLLTVLIAWPFVALIAHSIRRSLRQVSDAARALAAGNLAARSEVASQDEVGELATAMNKMADDLQNMVDKLLAEADRDAFAAQLGQALEMAESESDVREVVSRAMPQIAENLPTELLVADSARNNLSRFAQSPTAGAPGCDVEGLSGCAAVRRGTPLVFADSDALNACPRLRNRACGPVSAVCVPLSFMGRSFGVLHAAGTVRKTPTAQKTAQLAALASQAGSRIGTLRAFAHTNSQAKTDGLTGIGNRRAIEEVVQELNTSGAPYAFALADLDRFKQLNDSLGHAAGDRALRLFADVLRQCVRDGDYVGRWGGEEFALVFRNASAAAAFEVVERVRAGLAEELLTAGGPAFTASFGVADSTMSDSFDSQLRMADEALYRAKAAGRDRACIHGEPQLPSARSALA